MQRLAVGGEPRAEDLAIELEEKNAENSRLRRRCEALEDSMEALQHAAKAKDTELTSAGEELLAEATSCGDGVDQYCMDGSDGASGSLPTCDSCGNG